MVPPQERGGAVLGEGGWMPGCCITCGSPCPPCCLLLWSTLSYQHAGHSAESMGLGRAAPLPGEIPYPPLPAASALPAADTERITHKKNSSPSPGL